LRVAEISLVKEVAPDIDVLLIHDEPAAEIPWSPVWNKAGTEITMRSAKFTRLLRRPPLIAE